MTSIYQVKFSNSGYRRLKKLTRTDIVKIIRKLKILESFSSSTPNIKKLSGSFKSFYRLRIGDIRVIFEVDPKNKIIWVLDTGYRGSIYR